MNDPKCDNVTIYISPWNSQYYTPECAPELKPSIGQAFQKLETSIEFYRKYATTCEFDTRLGTCGFDTRQTIVANILPVDSILSLLY
ncbi:hypothetical protein CASFOL_017711 [Castilleja foliolosa]|uniref:Uncharacterized protein n=1 Tax=Castilleja foliolosa TaxID=1961234 RepID=A0ABD3D7Q4_9LAMI